MAAKRPILAVGPVDGDAATILTETEAGIMVDFNDEIATKEAILSYYNCYKTNTLQVNNTSVHRFSRRSLTAELAKLISDL